MNYSEFLIKLDEKLEKYFLAHKEFINCKPGCSLCCEKGEYPLSQIELEYLMHGYAALEDRLKIQIQKNVKNIVPGGVCPFLVDKKCSVYSYRPIICRVHGIAYVCGKEVVKLPFCVSEGKNYADVYEAGEITINPVLENLDTQNVLKDFNYGEIRNLADWLK